MYCRYIFLFIMSISNLAFSSPKVVVIGAGLAGLTAAYRLHQQGCDVELYEAQNKVGGRVFSVNVNGEICELGGQNIADGGEANHLYQLIDEFDLQVTESRVPLNHTYFHPNGTFKLNQLDKNFDPAQLKSKINELLPIAHSLKDILEALVDKDDPLYQATLIRLLSYEGGLPENLSPVYAETLYNMLLGGVCAVHPGTEEELNFAEVINIEGGNSLLAHKMAEALGSNVHLNMPLVSVQKDNHYILTFLNRQKVKADILVLAIPCSVYKDISFENGIIPSEKLNVIKDIKYGEHAKILIPLPNPLTDTSGWMFGQTLCFKTAPKTLALYQIGASSYFTRQTISESYKNPRMKLEDLHGEECPPYVEPVYAASIPYAAYDTPVGYSWPNTSYQAGSYSYISPGQEFWLNTFVEENGELYKRLFTPLENSLYFAGEHASILNEVPGTMEAACESGDRIARVVLNRFKKYYY